MDDSTAEDQLDVTQNSTKYDKYSNKSTEKGKTIFIDIVSTCMLGLPDWFDSDL